jgi:hypothetical protein
MLPASCRPSDHFWESAGIGDVPPSGTALVTEFAPRRVRALDRVLAQQTQKEQTQKE